MEKWILAVLTDRGKVMLEPVFRIHVFFGLPDPDPLVRGMDPDPDPSIIMQQQ